MCHQSRICFTFFASAKMKYLIIVILFFNFRTTFGQTPQFVNLTNQLGIKDIEKTTPKMANGASAADYDNDGDVDFFLATDIGIPDRVYRNLGNGEFEEVAATIGLASTKRNQAALWFDYTGDGLLDIVVLGVACIDADCDPPIFADLYKQTSEGSFVNTTLEAGIIFGNRYNGLERHGIGGIAAGDINHDGFLDLVITVWGGSISLFINNGDGTFSDYSDEGGFEGHKTLYFQPVILDFNNDGLLDIYCNVDFYSNELWINHGTSFVEVAAEAQMDSNVSEMGMALGDYDNDGDIDIYATNISHPTDKTSPSHNILLRNESEQQNVRFSEIANSLEVAFSGWDWGTTFFDANNDGWLDLTTTNGWTYTDMEWPKDKSRLWLNKKNGRFDDVSVESGINDDLEATTLISFDIDRDGDLDLLQTLKDDPDTKKPLMLYANQMSTTFDKGNYLVIKPRMEGANHHAIGAIIRIKTGGMSCMRLITAGISFYGQEPAEAFFGVGKAKRIDKLRIEWPDRLVTEIYEVAANQVLTINNTYRLDAPRSLLVEKIDGQAILSWKDNSNNETGFLIQRSHNEAFYEYVEFQLEANTSEYRDSDISSDNTYYYRVRAFDEIASSSFSNEVVFQKEIISNVDSRNFSYLQLYPVPSEGSFSIQMNNSYYGKVQFTIINRIGKTVSERSLFKRSTEFSRLITTDLNPDIYFVKIQMGSHLEYHKVIINR